MFKFNAIYYLIAASLAANAVFGVAFLKSRETVAVLKTKLSHEQLATTSARQVAATCSVEVEKLQSLASEQAQIAKQARKQAQANANQHFATADHILSAKAISDDVCQSAQARVTEILKRQGAQHD